MQLSEIDPYPVPSLARSVWVRRTPVPGQHGSQGGSSADEGDDDEEEGEGQGEEREGWGQGDGRSRRGRERDDEEDLGGKEDEDEPEVAGDYHPAPKHWPQVGSWEVYVVATRARLV